MEGSEVGIKKNALVKWEEAAADDLEAEKEMDEELIGRNERVMISPELLLPEGMDSKEEKSTDLRMVETAEKCNAIVEMWHKIFEQMERRNFPASVQVYGDGRK